MLVKSRIEGGSQESKKVLPGGRNPYPAVGCRVGGLIVRNVEDPGKEAVSF